MCPEVVRIRKAKKKNQHLRFMTSLFTFNTENLPEHFLNPQKLMRH